MLIKLRKFRDKFGYQVMGITGFLVILEIISRILGPYKLPRVTDIFVDFFIYINKIDLLAIQGGGENGFLPHLLYTVGRTIFGAITGILLGIVTGIILSKGKNIRAFSKYIIGALRVIPPLVIIPFFLMWFGPTVYTQFLMVVFYCASMLVITTSTAISNINEVYINYGYTLGASKNYVYRSIILPSIIPELIGGLRVTLGVSWGIQIVTELMGSQRGMGQVFSMMIPMQSLDVIICGILWICVIAVLTDFIIAKIARHYTSWMPTN